MKYIANPVEVDAFRIAAIVKAASDESPMILKLDNGKLYSPNAGMLARMTPVVGDYVVEQSDGYVYLNPKHVFERKYRPDDAPIGIMEAIRGAVARGGSHAANSAKLFDSDLAEAIAVEISNLRVYVIAKSAAEPNALELGAMVRAAGLAGE
jgi:hypothetical protein